MGRLCCYCLDNTHNCYFILFYYNNNMQPQITYRLSELMILLDVTGLVVLFSSLTKESGSSAYLPEVVT